VLVRVPEAVERTLERCPRCPCGTLGRARDIRAISAPVVVDQVALRHPVDDRGVPVCDGGRLANEAADALRALTLRSLLGARIGLTRARRSL
jgi:hypothetical protein